MPEESNIVIGSVCFPKEIKFAGERLCYQCGSVETEIRVTLRYSVIRVNT